MTDAEDKELLARFAPNRRVDPGVGYEAVTDLWYVLTDRDRTTGDQRGYTATHLDVTGSDLGAALRLLPSVRSFLDIVERDVLAAWMDRGATWSSLAEQLGYASGDALRQRYRRLGGERTWPAGRRPAESAELNVPSVRLVPRTDADGWELGAGEPLARTYNRQQFEYVNCTVELDGDLQGGLVPATEDTAGHPHGYTVRALPGAMLVVELDDGTGLRRFLATVEPGEAPRLDLHTQLASR